MNPIQLGRSRPTTPRYGPSFYLFLKEPLGGVRFFSPFSHFSGFNTIGQHVEIHHGKHLPQPSPFLLPPYHPNDDTLAFTDLF